MEKSKTDTSKTKGESGWIVNVKREREKEREREREREIDNLQDGN